MLKKIWMMYFIQLPLILSKNIFIRKFCGKTDSYISNVYDDTDRLYKIE